VRDKELEGYFTTPHDNPPKWLCMLTAYLDESGHEQRDWQFVAGFFGNDEQWGKFCPLWKQALGQRKKLHMKELRWNHKHADRRVKKLLERLAPIPTACGLTPIVGGVRYGDYEDLVSDLPESKAFSGYVHCIYTLVLQTLRMVPATERIEFLFEDRGTYKEEVNQVFELPLRSDKLPFTETIGGIPKIAKWGFIPKGTSILTDAGDYAAFAMHTNWTDPKSKKASWTRPLLQEIDNVGGVGAIMKRDMIRRIMTATRWVSVSNHVDSTIKDFFERAKKRDEKQ
jgi:hypothetical protein